MLVLALRFSAPCSREYLHAQLTSYVRLVSPISPKLSRITPLLAHLLSALGIQVKLGIQSRGLLSKSPFRDVEPYKGRIGPTLE